MRIRKKEAELLLEILDKPHDNVDDLVDNIWKTIDVQRRAHEQWIVIVNHGQGFLMLYGMYETMAAAEKDLAKYRSTTGGERATIKKVLSPSDMFGDPISDFR